MTPKNDRGQALVEALLVFPALLALMSLVVPCLAFWSAKIQMSFYAQELPICYFKRGPLQSCENQIKIQMKRSLQTWGFEVLQLKTVNSPEVVQIEIVSSWLGRKIKWKFFERAKFQI